MPHEENPPLPVPTASSPTRYLERPGGRIAYDVTGTGPLVIGVPGMGDLRSNFRYMVPALAEAGYRVATLDLRGHGDSDATFDAYDDVAAASDVLALIEHLGGPAVVVGNSMGAGAAAWAAAERPDAVAGLVLAGPFVRNAPVGAVALLLFRLALLRPWGAWAWNAYIPKLYPGRPPADLNEHRRRIRESLSRPGHWAAFSSTSHTSHAPVEARLEEVRAPTLVIMGGADPDFADPAAEATWVADRLGASVLVVPEAGHYPHAEYPEVVNPRLLSFLKEKVRHA
ncbi:MAG: alpha/beta hydrolase [Gemmatimonadota bacterium]|jgi:pimeloyl-ACP methyl ester carboxylesterase